MQEKDKIAINIFIDAFGWELYNQNTWFLERLATFKTPLKSILGYSSACIPSIITSRPPSEHGYWSSFYYSPGTSPFRIFKYLDFLPAAITDSARVRRYISKIAKRLYGFSGYFGIYSVPFKYLPYFDYQEKYDIWIEGGMKGSATIFDKLRQRQINFFLEKDGSDKTKFEKLNKALAERKISFAYLHLNELDNLLHLNGKKSGIVKNKIRDYDIQIRELYDNAKKYYGTVDLTVFSDHGMKEVTAAYNLIKDIESLNLAYGRDYAAFYDATMARFWFLNTEARNKITDRLEEIREGRMLRDDELESFGVYFKDHKYGDAIFLMNPGFMIIPSFMGRKPLRGMHGYHPDDPDSFAIYLTTADPEARPQTILDIFSFILI